MPGMETVGPRQQAQGRGVARRRLGLLALVLPALLASLWAAATVRADSYDERRIRAGARMFRALLAADLALETKARDGRLEVLVLGGEPALVAEVSGLIAPAGGSAIRGLPLVVERLDAPASLEGRQPVGVFLAGPPGAGELEQLVRWGITHKVILYSPFEGHVERGATAGLSIEAKVLPYLNAQTLQASGVTLKPLFLKVAKVHP
jgi:hypothetical protein